MSLIKSSLLNSVAVIIKMMTMLGINKVLAIYVGPSGYTIIGQFQNFIQMVTMLAGGAINVGVVRYTSENFDKPEKQIRLWQTAGCLTLISSLLISLIIVFFRKFFALEILLDEKLSSVLLVFSCSIVFFVLNVLLNSILIGKKELLKYVLSNIIGSLLSLVFVMILVSHLGIYGALVSLSVYQAVSFFFTLLLCLKSSWFKITYLYGGFDIDIAKKLLNYALMSVTTALITPATFILIRHFLIDRVGAEMTGFWDALTKLSSAYLMLITSSLSVYYLPRLSEIKNQSDLRNEIGKTFKLVTLVGILMATGIYLFREFVVDLLFSHSFQPVVDLMKWQLVGDVFKVMSWVFSFVFLAKGFTSIYISLEFIFNIGYLFLLMFFVNQWGLEGVSVAHLINYGIYLLITFGVLKVKKIL